MVLIGTLKGNGAGFTKLMERLIRGVWTPTAMEFMQPSLLVLYFILIAYYANCNLVAAGVRYISLATASDSQISSHMKLFKLFCTTQQGIWL